MEKKVITTVCEVLSLVPVLSITFIRMASNGQSMNGKSTVTSFISFPFKDPPVFHMLENVATRCKLACSESTDLTIVNQCEISVSFLPGSPLLSTSSASHYVIPIFYQSDCYFFLLLFYLKNTLVITLAYQCYQNYSGQLLI